MINETHKGTQGEMETEGERDKDKEKEKSEGKDRDNKYPRFMLIILIRLKGILNNIQYNINNNKMHVLCMYCSSTEQCIGN